MSIISNYICTHLSIFPSQLSFSADLSDEGEEHDEDEEHVSMDAGEDVALAVDLARVDLVEERHHDERVEDDRQVLRRMCFVGDAASAVDVQQDVAYRSATEQSKAKLSRELTSNVHTNYKGCST